MRWNNKLARSAAGGPTPCARTASSNIPAATTATASSSAQSPEPRPQRAAAGTPPISSWTSEVPLYDRLTGNCTGGRQFTECGHFGLMVHQKNQKIGCRRAECYKGGIFITCNYFLHDHDP